MRKFLLLCFSVLGTGALAFFTFAPRYIDQSKNLTGTYPEAFLRQTWYDSIPFIADLHCDLLLWDRDFFKHHSYGHVDLPRMQQGSMAFQAFTVVSKVPAGINIERNPSTSDQIGLLSFAQLRSPATWFSSKARALDQCSQLHDYADRSEGMFRVITSQQELQTFIQDRKSNQKLTAGMLGLEGAHCLENDLSNLQVFYNAGVRYIGLTHFFDNEWAGSAHGEKKEGLTGLGKQLIRKMDSSNMIIDLAHASMKTIDDVLALTKRPIIVSHTGVKGVCNNQRNLSDQHLIAIGKRNGLVGIGLWETAVCGTDVSATARSIRYAADMIGVDKVALGSDFDGAIGTHVDAAGLPLVAIALEQEGFDRAEIELIMGGNIRDFLLRNLPAN